MKNAFARVQDRLRKTPATWLVTGAAGFIGCNLVEALLQLGQNVIGLDNFASGHQRNLDDVAVAVGANSWKRFRFIRGDVSVLETCNEAIKGVEYVLHQAALGSVPRSIAQPLDTNAANVTGFLNMLVAARDAGVQRFVYAGSSSTYGDHSDLPKVEHRIGKPLSPYAVSKYVDELYAEVFSRTYGFNSIGLRYFNVFGPRQDPDGAYAAVIPKWVGALLKGDEVWVNGDGQTSRDFCYINNAVQANLLAALAPDEAAGQVYNVAVGERTTLNALLNAIVDELAVLGLRVDCQPKYGNFRPGDIRDSQADISKATEHLGYEPTHRLDVGLAATLRWFIRFYGK